TVITPVIGISLPDDGSCESGITVPALPGGGVWPPSVIRLSWPFQPAPRIWDSTWPFVSPDRSGTGTFGSTPMDTVTGVDLATSSPAFGSWSTTRPHSA